MSLSRIQSLRVAAVLEDCSDQLDILGLTLKVQVGRKRDTEAEQEKTRLTKLRSDCQYISQQIAKLRLELEEKQSLSSLLQLVEEEEQRWKAEDERREAKTELEQRNQTLWRQKEEHQRKTEKLKDVTQQANDLKQQLHVCSLKIANKKKLEEKTNERQLQQIQRETSETEKLLEEQRELLQIQLKEERRVHQESETFLRNRQEELQQQLQLWQQHTKQKLQQKKQQLNNVCCRRTVNLDRLMEMRRKFNEMEQVVMEDREEQEQLRQQQVEARAATKLQAWWRGHMVRQGFCTFKKAEEDKKGKKKKDGKKKKKKK